jgi:hypothetical protein
VVDHLGPFTMAPCRARYVLTVICQLTGYAHAIAVKTTSAEETARALYDNVFSKHGLCRTLISDNASNFISEVYKCLASLFDIRLTYASSYNPKSTAKCERLNSSLLNILKCLTKDQPENWPRFLSAAIKAVNNTPNSITGVSPSLCVFGRDTTALKNFTLNDDQVVHMHDLITEMKCIQDWAIRKQSEYKTDYDEKQQAAYNANKTPSKLHENAVVFWRKPALPDPRENSKLQSSIRKYIAFDIRHESCQLRDPVTNKVYKHRVSLNQLIFPQRHNENVARKPTQAN